MGDVLFLTMLESSIYFCYNDLEVATRSCSSSGVHKISQTILLLFVKYMLVYVLLWPCQYN